MSLNLQLSFLHLPSTSRHRIHASPSSLRPRTIRPITATADNNTTTTIITLDPPTTTEQKPELTPLAEEPLTHEFSSFIDLQPQRATVEDMFRILNDGKVGELDSVFCPEGTVIDDPETRRAMFTSMATQKVLQSTTSGDSTAMYVLVNLLAEYDIPRIIWDYITGNLVMPDPKSMNFKSMFAFIDTRVELDPNIKPVDDGYLPHLSIMAAKLAYENEARIKSIVRGKWDMEFLGFFNCWEDFQQAFCTQAFMMSDKPIESGKAELVFVAFRGTDDVYDMCTDLDFSWYEVPGIGKVHAGFMKALGLQKNGWPKDITQNPDTPFAYYTIRKKLRDIVKKNPNAKIVVTGHSLGGALSVLLPVILKYHGEDKILERLEGVYTFGQPRIGDAEFGKYAENVIDNPKRRYFRYVYNNDLVARVPFDNNSWLFKHFGKCVFFDTFYTGKEVDKVPNENYFSPWYMMPKYMDAMFEMTRSFVIGYVKGRDYEESAMLRMMRAMGMLIPGLPAHSPQDYNNVTRLGSVNPSSEQ